MRPRNPIHVFRENVMHLQAGRPLSDEGRDRAFDAMLAEMTRADRARLWRRAAHQHFLDQRRATLRADALARRFWMPMKSIAHWFKLRQVRDAMRRGEELGQW